MKYATRGKLIFSNPQDMADFKATKALNDSEMWGDNRHNYHEGYQEVSWDLRYNTQQARDSVCNSALASKATATDGEIFIHDCMDDECGACLNEVCVDAWGTFTGNIQGGE
jgi:hypothetical protein